MAYRTVALLALALQACSAYAAGNVCTSYSSLNTCSSAKAYCSSRYPVAPVISTATTHVSATTTIVSTVRTTSTAHVTSTSTITDTTVTQTTTVTAGSPKLKRRSPAKKLRKRNPAAKPAPCQAAFSSLTRQSASAQKTICSCIETRATSTTTTTVRSVATAHSTTTSTIVTTVSAQTTTRVSATKTTTITVQPSPTGPPCSNGNYKAGSNTFNVECGTNITTTNNMIQYGTADNIDVCISDCNSQASSGLNQAICGAYFQRASQECTCYTRNTLSTPSCDTSFGNADPDYDTAVFTSSSGGTGSGPACTSGDYTAGSNTFDIACGTNITTTDNMVSDGTADTVDVCTSNCNSKFMGSLDQAICAVYFQRASGDCTCYVRNTIATKNCGSSFGDADPDYDTAILQSGS